MIAIFSAPVLDSDSSDSHRPDPQAGVIDATRRDLRAGRTFTRPDGIFHAGLPLEGGRGVPFRFLPRRSRQITVIMGETRISVTTS
jgi:hypothetical protein